MTRRRAHPAGWLLVLACLLAAFTGAVAEDGGPTLEIIPLKYRLFDEVRPLLEPLLEPGATLTGTGNQVIVRTSPANLAELRQALSAIDQRQQRLRVSVSQSRIGDSAYDSYGIDASTGGRRGSIAIGRPPGGPDASFDARIARTHGRDEGTRVQTVLTVDGQAAWVNVVDARPQPWLNQAWTPYGPVVQEGIGWQAAQSGFFVTPRLRGDEVQIEIASRQERFAGDGSGSLDSSSVDTVVAGRLGEWLPIGGTAGAQGELLAHTRRQSATHTGFWVRVDPVH